MPTIIGQDWQWMDSSGPTHFREFNFSPRPTVAHVSLYRADGADIAGTGIYKYSALDSNGQAYTRQPGDYPIINDERVTSVTWWVGTASTAAYAAALAICNFWG